MIHQLRIYEIFETNKAAFHARFRDHAARIMKTYGFQIAAMWETRTSVVVQKFAPSLPRVRRANF